MDLLQTKQYDLKRLTEFAVGANAFQAANPQKISVQSVFFQTGYLTIKGYNNSLYTLDFPNYEVKKSFYDSVATHYAHLDEGEGQNYTVSLIQSIKAGNLDDFFATLGVFFANVPYDLQINHEKYYQSLFYAIFTLIGFNIEAEVHTNQGRMGTQTSARSLCSHEVEPWMATGRTTRTFDNINSTINCVLQTDDKIYIIEFKLNDTKEAALQQILDKKYAQKYQNSSKEVVLLGVEFDPKTRNIGDYIVGIGPIFRN